MKKEESTRNAAKEKMIFGGKVHVAGPNLLARLAAGKVLFEYSKRAMEFFLQVENAKEDKVVEFSTWADLPASGVRIKTNIYSDDIIPKDFYLELETSEERNLAFTLSLEQAKVIFALLQDFITAREAVLRLQKALPQPSL